MRWLFAILLLAGCTSIVEGTPSASGDVDGYLRAIQSHLPGSETRDYLDAGYAVCEDLRAGQSEDQVINHKIDHGLTSANATTIVFVSIEYLCPEFN